MDHQKLRYELDNLVTSLVYLEQFKGYDIPDAIYQQISKIERLTFEDYASEQDRQLELFPADSNTLD